LLEQQSVPLPNATMQADIFSPCVSQELCVCNLSPSQGLQTR